MSSALRSFSRRNLTLSPKWFCKTSPSSLHHVKDYNTKPTFSASSLLLAPSFHWQVFFEDRKKLSFGQPLVSSSGVFLCRHISSSSSITEEELSIKLEALGDIVEKLTPEKAVEAAMSTTIDGCENFSFPVNCVHYVINGIHDLTGCNWWMSIVLTAFLVNGLMSPLSLRIQRQAWELKILSMSIQKVKRMMQTCDPKDLAKHKKWEAECTQNISLRKIISRMEQLPLYCIFFIVVQAAYRYEPAVYFYLITYRISLYTLHLMCRSKQIAKLSKELGLRYVPLPASEQQKIMARVISVMRGFIDMVKKKKKKKE